jgi:FkbM family methyltransferase
MAFEPEPKNYSLLCENVQRNAVGEQVRLFQLALADKNSDVRLELCDDNWGNHRIRPAHKPASVSDWEFSRVCTVPARALDEFLAEQAQPAASFRLIKIDCEGAEVAVFRGAKRTLANTEYLLSEYYPAAMERAGFDAGEFRELVKPHFSTFSRLGGQGFDYDPAKHSGGVDFQPISQLEDDIRKPFNSLNYTQYLFRK